MPTNYDILDGNSAHQTFASYGADNNTALNGILTKLNASIAATQSGTWNIGSITTLPALATGANVIGGVTQSGTWNVGTVSTVTSLSQFAGAAINLGAGTVGTGTLRVTLASDGAMVTAIGAQADTSATSDTGTFSLIALFKRALGYLSTIATAAADTVTASLVDLSKIAGTATATGNGVVGAGVQRVAVASDNTPFPIKIDQTTPGTTNAVSVQTPADVITFTPTLDTSAYASGDVLFATTSLGTVTRVNDGRAVLMSLTGIDKSKNKPAMTLLFYQTNVTSAAANAANALSDSDQANLLGYVRILAADWIDYANNSITCKTAINLLLEAVSGAQNVYVVGILDAGTPTFAASDLVFKLGVVQA